MTLRTRLFIVISLIILLVLAISIALVARSRKPAAPAPVETPPSTAIDQSNFSPGQVAELPAAIPAPAGKVSSPLEVQQNTARQMAKIFLERVASYSSDSNFQNIREIQTLASPMLWKQLSKTITTAGNGPFVGVTTEALSTNLTSWSDIKAVIAIKTRQTSNRNGVVTVAYRDATVTVVKIGDNWLVDSYAWSK